MFNFFFVVLKLFSMFPIRTSATLTNQKNKKQALNIISKFGIKYKISN